MTNETSISLENVSLDFPTIRSGATMFKEFITGRVKMNRSKYFRALDCVSLDISKGEVFGVIGPNGAGKSTILRMMAGFMLPIEAS